MRTTALGKEPLDRHRCIYPSNGHGAAVKGHARAAEEGISTIYRRQYETFERIRRALRDPKQNPE